MTPAEFAARRLRIWQCAVLARDPHRARWDLEREFEREFGASRVLIELGGSTHPHPAATSVRVRAEDGTRVGITLWRRPPLSAPETRWLRLLGREVAAALVAVREFGAAERRRWAVELHQGPAQDLAAALLALRAVRGLLARDHELARKLLRRSEKRVEEAVKAVRRAIRALREGREAPAGFTQAVRQTWDRLCPGAGARLELDVPPTDALPPHVTEVLTTVACEAVTNAVRHGGATHVRVRVRQASQAVTLHVTDNGRGLSSSRGEDSFGLRLMRDCVEALGGWLTVAQPAKGGTKVLARIPLGPPWASRPSTGKAEQLLRGFHANTGSPR